MENVMHPVQRSPAPWTLKAESYLLFLKLRELPQGLYDRLEEAWQNESLGRFEGGLGAVMIVRYTETPVGRLFSQFINPLICHLSMLPLPNLMHNRVSLSKFVLISMFFL
jgi:hypothetical protein